MSLYLLVEKRLNNVELNVDENIRNREEKRRMCLKAFSRPHAHAAAVFLKKISLSEKNEKAGWAWPI